MAPLLDTDHSSLQVLDNVLNDQYAPALTIKQQLIENTSSTQDVDSRSSIVLQVNEMTNREVKGGVCKYLMKTEPLLSGVKCIIVSTKLLQSSKAESKIVLTLYDCHDQVKKRLDLFGKIRDTPSSPNRTIFAKEQIISALSHGDYYQLECKVTPGQTDFITLKGLSCKIISSRTLGSAHQLTDLANRKGIFVGFLDYEGEMNGKGSFHYLENGFTFVGQFDHGAWIKGVLYYGDIVKLTMKDSKWDETRDTALMKIFPHNFQTIVKKFGKRKLSWKNSVSSSGDDTPPLGLCGCMTFFLQGGGKDTSPRS